LLVSQAIGRSCNGPFSAKRRFMASLHEFMAYCDLPA